MASAACVRGNYGDSGAAPNLGAGDVAIALGSHVCQVCQ
jgi:hypothetical protein